MSLIFSSIFEANFLISSRSFFQSPSLELLLSPPWFNSLFCLYTDIHLNDSVLCSYTLPRYHFTVLYFADVVAPD